MCCKYTCLRHIWQYAGEMIHRDLGCAQLHWQIQIKMQMLTGIDQSAYSKIERGERYLSFEQCRRVAVALGTSMDYLAGLTDEKKPYPRAKE